MCAYCQADSRNFRCRSKNYRAPILTDGIEMQTDTEVVDKHRTAIVLRQTCISSSARLLRDRLVNFVTRLSLYGHAGWVSRGHAYDRRSTPRDEATTEITPDKIRKERLERRAFEKMTGISITSESERIVTDKLNELERHATRPMLQHWSVRCCWMGRGLLAGLGSRAHR